MKRKREIYFRSITFNNLDLVQDRNHFSSKCKFIYSISFFNLFNALIMTKINIIFSLWYNFFASFHFLLIKGITFVYNSLETRIANNKGTQSLKRQGSRESLEWQFMERNVFRDGYIVPTLLCPKFIIKSLSNYDDTFT